MNIDAVHESVCTIEKLYESVLEITEGILNDPCESVISETFLLRNELFKKIEHEEEQIKTYTKAIPVALGSRVSSIIQKILNLDKMVSFVISSHMSTIRAEMKSLYASGGAAKAYAQHRRAF